MLREWPGPRGFLTGAQRSAERVDFSRSSNDRTSQRSYLESAPYADERDWDNVGFEEEVALPASFDPRPCYAPP